MRNAGIFVILCLCAVLPVKSNAKLSDLAIAVAMEHIDVTVGFNGSSIELFGDRRDDMADIAIVVEGPKKDVTIWQKARVMGTWVNRRYAKFNDMPTYYHYAISRDAAGVPFFNVMFENGIGHDGLFHKINGKKPDERKNIKIFQKALLKKNTDLGVFFKKPAEVKFMNDNFFRVRFDIPPSAPTGEYKIHSFLIKDGKVIEQALNLMKIEQVGLNAFIHKSAQEYSLLYALVCIFSALFSGWLISALKVKP